MISVVTYVVRADAGQLVTVEGHAVIVAVCVEKMVDVVNCSEEVVAEMADEDGTTPEERMVDEEGTMAVERTADEDDTTTADEDWRALQDLCLCERRGVYVQ